MAVGSDVAWYLQEARLGGDHQDVGVAFILHGQELVLGGAVGTEQEGRAGPSDLPFVGHIAELVELPVVVGHIVSWTGRAPVKPVVSQSHTSP